MTSRKLFCSNDSGFTLIELLVVIAIIAILSLVLIFTLNPAELLAEARDSTRLSDLTTLQGAISTYSVATSAGSLGSSTVVYISVPDPVVTSTAGDHCDSLGLPSLPSPWTYHCASPNAYKNVDGTGWLPLDFRVINSQSVINVLPADPKNQTSSGLFYTYETNGSNYEITAAVESGKYGTGGSNDVVSKDNGKYSDLLEKGSILSLAPIDFVYQAPSLALIGFWPLNEGTGTIVFDGSSNATGSWSGTKAGTSGYYSAGYGNESYAGYFNGSDDAVILLPQSLNDFTVCAWFKTTSAGAGTLHYQLMQIMSSEITGVFSNDWGFGVDSNGKLALGTGQSDVTIPSNTSVNTGSWVFGCGTRVKSTGLITLFVNGLQNATGTGYAGNTITGNSRILIGQSDDTSNIKFNGTIGHARLYSRVLSASEISGLYTNGQ
jgi:prepilin-type N-terminal cleavage/methylation domain-containing protein